MDYKIILGDQKTDEWQKLREGKITGSVAKQVKGTGNAFLYETLAMMTTKRDPKQARGEHVDRGIELEPEARAAYVGQTGFQVFTVAFIENGRLGISPDGIVFKKKVSTVKGNLSLSSIKKIDRLLEIKCPDTNNHIRYIIENRLPAEHKDQVIHAFVTIDDLEEVDFVSYDPKFKHKPLHIITIRRSDLIVDISTAKVAYDRFLQKLDKYYSTLVL